MKERSRLNLIYYLALVRVYLKKKHANLTKITTSGTRTEPGANRPKTKTTNSTMTLVNGGSQYW